MVGELPGRTTMVAADGSADRDVLPGEPRRSGRSRRSRPLMQQALLAIEDRRFYEHGPVDLRGILRALVTNLQAGEVEEGASTLTMQYARNLLVIEAGDDEQELAAALATTPERKIAEIKYAIALEEEYTKDEILQGYLNTVFFGNRSYGIEVAARNYFSVTAVRAHAPAGRDAGRAGPGPERARPDAQPGGRDRSPQRRARQHGGGRLHHRAGGRATRRRPRSTLDGPAVARTAASPPATRPGSATTRTTGCSPAPSSAPRSRSGRRCSRPAACRSRPR